MERDDIYSRWANRLRERYGGAIEAERARLAADESVATAVRRAGLDPAELEAQRDEVATLRNDVAVLGARLRETIQRALTRALRQVESTAVEEACAECPELLDGDLTLAQVERKLSEAAAAGGALDERRRRLDQATAEAHELTAGAGVADAEVATLSAERAQLLGEVEELRRQLRGRHGLGPDILAGLETVQNDVMFQKLLAQLLRDARREAEWGLERDVLQPFRQGSSSGGVV